jgi:hypothetical protein
LIHFGVLKNVDFLIFLIGSDVSLFGYFIPFFFLPSKYILFFVFSISAFCLTIVFLAHATYLGLSASQGSALVAVGSAGNSIGLIIVG